MLVRYIIEGSRRTSPPGPKRTDRHMPERDFESIYTDFSRLVYWAAYGVLSNKEQTEDVTQEVFITVLKNMDKLAPLDDAQIKGWLYRVSVNAALDFKRRNRNEVLSDEPVGQEVADLSALPDEEVADSETASVVRAAITELDERYATVLRLHYFSEMSVEDIADTLDISEGTVKSRLSRGRAILYRKLSAKGIML